VLFHVIPAPIFIGINSSRNPVFFKRQKVIWTPVYTGETNTVGFFHSFPPAKGGKIFGVIQTPYNSILPSNLDNTE